MNACFCCVKFSFSITSQEIGLGKRLRNDLFCIEWDVKSQLSQSINFYWATSRCSVKMQSIATDVAWSVHLSVSCAEMAEGDFWAVDFGVVWILFFCVCLGCNCLCVFCVCLGHFVLICLHLLCWVWLGRMLLSLPREGALFGGILWNVQTWHQSTYSMLFNRWQQRCVLRLPVCCNNLVVLCKTLFGVYSIN